MLKAVAMAMAVLVLPGVAFAEDCGRVSTFFDGPVTKHVHEARIGVIDNNNVLLETPEHRLSPGKHELRIYEFIDAPELKVPARHRGYGKILTLEVEADKVYRIGARFNHLKPFDRTEFWEPVVWQVSDQPCEK